MIGEKLRTEQRHPGLDETLNIRAKKSFATRRKGSADEFHRSLMDERKESRDTLFIEHATPRNSSAGPIFILKPERQPSLDIFLDHESQVEGRNPMTHFEHELNYTVRPRCPKISVPRSDEESREDIDEMLCNEIAEAFEENFFVRTPVFDNRWENESQEQETNDSLSIQKDISRISTQRNLTALTSPASRTIDSVDNAGLRFQHKQATWKLKSEMLPCVDKTSNNDSESFAGSRPPGAESTNKNNIGNSGDKYWTKNKDMQFKWTSEKINRELQTVRRFAFEPNGSKYKPLSSRVKRICSEDEFQAKRLAILVQDKFSKAPPLVKNINSGTSMSTYHELSDYMDSVRKSRQDHHRSALQSLQDKTLKTTFLEAKEKSDRIWLQCEKLEFLY